MSGLPVWNLGEIGSQGRPSRTNPLLRPQRDLGVGEARGIALALLRGDPGEGAIQMLVRDDDAGHEHGLVSPLEPVGEHATVAADRDGAVGGFAHEGGGPAEAAILDGVREEVETRL